MTLPAVPYEIKAPGPEAGQADRILYRLRTTFDGVCGFHFTYDEFPGIPRAAARICELRKDGWQIVTEPCDRDDHRHMSKHIKYRLKAWDEA